MAERKPVGASNNGNGYGGYADGRSLLDEDDEGMAKPPLPPRTGTGLSGGNGSSGGNNGRRRNLMDDEDEDSGNLRGWEVLQPGR
jgi:hypothetical protein